MSGNRRILTQAASVSAPQHCLAVVALGGFVMDAHLVGIHPETFHD
jgi:hypothetical protein